MSDQWDEWSDCPLCRVKPCVCGKSAAPPSAPVMQTGLAAGEISAELAAPVQQTEPTEDELDAERMRVALERIAQWAEAYPPSVFPEPDFARAHEVLKAAGMTLDAISASNMRHVITMVQEIAQKALRAAPPVGDIPREMGRDAELGRIALRYVDRMGDPDDTCDPLGKIVNEFCDAIDEAITRFRAEDDAAVVAGSTDGTTTDDRGCAAVGPTTKSDAGDIERDAARLLAVIEKAHPALVGHARHCLAAQPKPIGDEG